LPQQLPVKLYNKALQASFDELQRLSKYISYFSVYFKLGVEVNVSHYMSSRNTTGQFPLYTFSPFIILRQPIMDIKVYKILDIDNSTIKDLIIKIHHLF